MKRTKESAAAKRFHKVFGTGTAYRAFSEADDERLADRLAPVMRGILQKDGWCSYKEQVLWLCDPDDWKPAARAWFADVKDPQVVARTGFGELFVFDGVVYWYAMVHEPLVLRTVANHDWFFSQMLTASDFAPQTYLPDAVRTARKQAGALEWDEMYTYVPALALGGSESSSKIERVKANEALVMLAGLAPIERR